MRIDTATFTSSERLISDMQDTKDGIQTETKPLRIRRILALLALANMFTFVLTLIPFLTDLPSITYNGWITYDDIVRLLEPLVSLPLTFFILYESPIFQHSLIRKNETGQIVVIALFMVFTAIYQQGAGYHSAAALFKKPVKNLRDSFPNGSANYVALDDIYTWIRDVWEHEVSHYIYAIGGILVSFVYAFVYRNYTVTNGLLGIDRVLYVFASIFYGLIMGSVAVNFPSGGIVSLVLTVAYGFGVIGVYLVRKLGFRGLLSWGKYPVLQYYLNAYIIGFIIVIVWISAFGFKNLPSINRS